VRELVKTAGRRRRPARLHAAGGFELQEISPRSFEMPKRRMQLTSFGAGGGKVSRVWGEDDQNSEMALAVNALLHIGQGHCHLSGVAVASAFGSRHFLPALFHLHRNSFALSSVAAGRLPCTPEPGSPGIHPGR